MRVEAENRVVHWFVSTAHDGAVVDETLTRVAAAVREYAMLSS